MPAHAIPLLAPKVRGSVTPPLHPSTAALLTDVKKRMKTEFPEDIEGLSFCLGSDIYQTVTLTCFLFVLFLIYQSFQIKAWTK